MRTRQRMRMRQRRRMRTRQRMRTRTRQQMRMRTRQRMRKPDCIGLSANRPGIDGVISELRQVVPLHGDDARIQPSTYQEIATTLALLTKIAELRPDADKLAEVLRESQVFYENKLET